MIVWERIFILVCNFYKNINQMQYFSLKFFNLITKIEFFIKGNLVVSAAACMNFFSSLAYSVCKSCLNKGMNIFCRKIYCKFFIF